MPDTVVAARTRWSIAPYFMVDVVIATANYYVPDLDLVMPYNAAGLDDKAHDIAAQAWAAWEAAVCWDDEHSVKRLAEVRAVGAGGGLG